MRNFKKQHVGRWVSPPTPTCPKCGAELAPRNPGPGDTYFVCAGGHEVNPHRVVWVDAGLGDDA